MLVHQACLLGILHRQQLFWLCRCQSWVAVLWQGGKNGSSLEQTASSRWAGWSWVELGALCSTSEEDFWGWGGVWQGHRGLVLLVLAVYGELVQPHLFRRDTGFDSWSQSNASIPGSSPICQRWLLYLGPNLQYSVGGSLYRRRSQFCRRWLCLSWVGRLCSGSRCSQQQIVTFPSKLRDRSCLYLGVASQQCVWTEDKINCDGPLVCLRRIIQAEEALLVCLWNAKRSTRPSTEAQIYSVHDLKVWWSKKRLAFHSQSSFGTFLCNCLHSHIIDIILCTLSSWQTSLSRIMATPAVSL